MYISLLKPGVAVLLASSLPTLTTILLTLVALWCAFWVYVWIRYLPIIVRLIGEAPLLLPERGSPIAGGEECSFRTRDGVTLRGTYLKHRNGERRGIVLFAHELNGDRWNATPYATDLLDQGYDFFCFDFANHGASDVRPRFKPGPWVSTFDVVDLAAAVEYLSSRDDADPRGVGVLGFSRGGGAALAAAAADPRIRCLYLEGLCPTRATHLSFLKRYIDIYIPPPWTIITRNLPDRVYRVFLAAGRLYWAWRNHYPFADVEGAASAVSQPVLMVHGGRDTLVPREAAEDLERRIRGPSKLWVVPKARHNAAIVAEPEAYHRRLTRFFRYHLAPRRNHTAKAAAPVVQN